MMKKIALIVIVIGIISISLVFTLPVLSQVNSTTVDGTVYEETFDQVLNEQYLIQDHAGDPDHPCCRRVGDRDRVYDVPEKPQRTIIPVHQRR